MNQLPTWRRQYNFGTAEHQRDRNAINSVLDLAPSPGIESYSTFTGKVLVDNRTAPQATQWYALTVQEVTPMGGVYLVYVLDPESADDFDPQAGGVLNINLYGTRNIKGDYPGGVTNDLSQYWYGVDGTEAGLDTHDILTGRNLFRGIPWRRRAKDGTRVIEIIDGIVLNPCSQGLTATQMNSAF